MLNPLKTSTNIFSVEAIDGETRGFNEGLKNVALNSPPKTSLTPEQMRDYTNSQETNQHEPDETRSIKGRDGEIPIHIYKPKDYKGIYLHFHGGGGVVRSYGVLTGKSFAEKCGLLVIDVDYRLCPENPYPAGHNDCEDVAWWLIENAETDFGTDNLLIGGESAGAYYSLCTILRMRDNHGYTGFKRTALTYGIYDHNLTPSAWNFKAKAPGLNTQDILMHQKYLLPSEKGFDLYNPDVSPLYAELHDMPEAFFTVGTLDPLLDDSLFMYARWLAGGNKARLAVYPGGIHAFNKYPLKIAEKANDKIIEFLRNFENVDDEEEDFDELYEKAHELLDLKKFDEALKMFKKLKEMQPNNPQVLSNLGVIYFGLGKFILAHDELEAALKLDKNNEKIRANLQIVLKHLGIEPTA